MVREDLVNSAVSFLQDPSVATAPIDKRIAFLQSKNLTQEEIDVSLARAGDVAAGSVAPPPGQAPPNYAYQQAPPPPGYGYQGGYYQQPPPPELPKRDWRDWFIMATVMGGVGYGLYFTAKRYIVPLIAPPTPPLITQDKESIDASFTRAFALLDQVTADTAALKTAEESRTQRLDAALSELETVVASLKEGDRRRDDDARRTADDVRGLKDLIPKAMEAQKDSNEARLKELSTELKSLKTLVGNRVGGRPGENASGASALRGSYVPSSGNTSGNPFPSPFQPPTPGTQAATGSADGVQDGQAGGSSSAPAVAAPESTPAPTPSSYGRMTNGRAAIPAWQMAAAKKDAASEKKDTSESGTVTEATAA
ncbi:hypothetical protein K402DRAFT_393277 [Aulographum hederae CBS 113979]|uniref:Peroxisomal membrane protein PEX14 n=1 Tax=Aulographum hederae CBS 113979 TaxID=1176131 RepID=A0A6G1H221_9PEZI|nr:hypothetical protein K402DRAFT_393277 [Aulographum hederae CBS 113979]